LAAGWFQRRQSDVPTPPATKLGKVLQIDSGTEISDAAQYFGIETKLSDCQLSPIALLTGEYFVFRGRTIPTSG
jgi:hypothetical protein